MSLIKTVDLWLDDSEALQTPEQTLKTLSFPDDPLALAVASYRHWCAGGGRWADLNDMQASEDDRRVAEQLKSYYRERLVFEALKKTGQATVSEFRKKLGHLVNNELKITSGEVGLLMRMPYFYEEDQQVDKVMAKTVPAEQSLRGHTVAASFVLEKKVLRSRRSGDFYDYWFTSDHSPAAYRFTLKHDNSLRQFVESFMQQSFRVQANLYTHYMRGFWRGRPYYGMVLAGIA